MCRRDRERELLRRVAIRFGLLLAVLMMHVSPVAGLTVSEIARANLGAVPTLVALDENQQPLSLGSGFFIDDKGTLITNGHVIEGATQVVVRWRGQSGKATKVLRFDPQFDLVVLGTNFKGTPAVQLGDSELVSVGEEVVVLSNPQGLEGTVSSGILSGIRVSGGVKYLQITAPISPGSSGGPVFNQHGRVIGIATATLVTGQNLNFSLPINLLRNLPESSHTFRQVRVQAPSGEGIKEGRTLVVPTNIIPHRSFAKLSSVTFSIQNNTNDWIGKVKVFAAFYSYQREPMNYAHQEYALEVIPPKLAKQVTLHAVVEGFYTLVGMESREGSIEIRILDYQIIRRGGGAIDTLFKNK
jgi:hypothetical protein